MANSGFIKRAAKAAAIAVIGCGASLAQASHIDQLFVNITVDSSDGAGNFTLRYDQYFGSDGASWNGVDWTGFGYPYGTSFSISIASGPGTLSGPTYGGGFAGVSAEFVGLVDSSGTPTPGFGFGQFNTRFVNDTSDAALFSDFVSFSISGFDNTQTYLVDVAANDCCQVIGPEVSFDGTLQFDPRQVITPGTGVPVPATLALLGLGLLGLGIRRKAA